MDEENADWPGNYKVKYWEPEWQSIILDKVKIIAEAGYDGVYLDIIDAYYYYEVKGRATAAQEMIDFVKKIGEVNPNLLVVPQNAVDLYEFEEYKGIIDGFGKEDTWYNDDDVQNAEETAYVLPFLDQAVADGKFVLAIDYPTQQTKICDFYNKCKEHNFICTVSNRDLSLNQSVICST